MMCNHCKANVENNLSRIDGVKAVHVELEKGVAYVEGDHYDPVEIISVIKELGYEYVEE